MKYFFGAALASIIAFSSYGQSNNASIAGTYKMPELCTGCDSATNTLTLTCNPKCLSGKYTLVNRKYAGCRKRTKKITGEWYVLENIGAAKKENVTVIVLDVLGRLETYPLLMVQTDGNLRLLKQRNPERFPEAVVRKEGKLYICKKGGHLVSLAKATRYRDNPFYHIYVKKS